MNTHVNLYTNPSSMEPLFPTDKSGKLEELAVELLEKSAKLSGTMNPITRGAIADFLRPMNSYYSNLIEGHDTHPIDINNALNHEYSDNKEKRNLQLEAFAHIKVLEGISTEIKDNSFNYTPTSIDFIKEIHKRFYKHLPEEFKEIKTKDGEIKKMIPGEIRKTEVQVGRHIAPKADNLNLFTKRFEEFYNPFLTENTSKINRIISFAAAHHRLAWIHPFLDGNGRVIRLFSDTCFLYNNVAASELWSISRGMARTNVEYKDRLANADIKRLNDLDGHGNLSNKMLEDFLFLESSIPRILDLSEKEITSRFRKTMEPLIQIANNSGFQFWDRK